LSLSSLAVRVATAAISLALVALVIFDAPLLSGMGGFGWPRAAALALGLAIGALCFAPVAWNSRALALIVSVGLTLAAAELVLRYALGPQYYAPYQFDDRLLYRLVPGAKRDYTLSPINGGHRIRYEINSRGFRGKELAAAGQSARVVVYGDSFIQAESSRLEDTFAERLKARLAGRFGSEVEVVNAGVAGYGPDQELRRMEHELAGLQPDLVVAAIYAGNDFGDIVRNKLYRLASDGSLHENPKAVVDEWHARLMAVSRSELIIKKIARNAANRLRGNPDQVFPTGREARRARVEASLAQHLAEHREYVVEGDNVVHELMSDPYNADVSLMPESESARYKIAMMERIIARMRQTATAQGVPLLFVLIPSPVDATEEHEFGEVDSVRYPAYRRSTLTDILEQICRRNQLPAVNLFGPFWEQRSRELYLKGGDDHWNARGQDFAAQLVSDFVVARGLLGATAKGTP
jgi:hypothetical protein